MEILKAISLGLVQAVTEFLPVSSSGHLVLAKTLLGVQEVGITFEVITHLATALAVIVFLRRRIGCMVQGIYRYIRFGRRAAGESAARDFTILLMLIVGSLPAVGVGLLVRDRVGDLFADVATTSIMLVVTGCFVLASGRLAKPRKPVGFRAAVVIGMAQACAIVPGLSRSGLTIGAGLVLGVARKEAFEFSLLLSVPAIIGAAVLEMVGGRIGGEPIGLVVAAVTAFGGGYLAISVLRRAVVGNRFHAFAYYLIPLGVAAIVWV